MPGWGSVAGCIVVHGLRQRHCQRTRPAGPDQGCRIGRPAPTYPDGPAHSGGPDPGTAPQCHEESRMRVYTLNAIRDIFLAVKDAYTPIDEGTLITAYRRK